MKKIIILLLPVLIISCSVNNDKLFEEVANEYIEYFLQSNPEWATDLGDHRYDGQVSNFTESAIAADGEKTRQFVKSLKEIDEHLLKYPRVDFYKPSKRCIFEMTCSKRPYFSVP